MSIPSRWGVAIPAVLLVLLALTALAHGLLVLSRFELEVGRAARHRLRARLAAEGAVRRALVEWKGAGHEALALYASNAGGGALPPAVDYRYVVQRVEREIFVVEGVGVERTGSGNVQVARAVWSLDPAARAGGFSAALEHRGPLALGADASLSGSAVAVPPDEWDPATCSPLGPAIDSLFPTGALPASGLLPPPVPRPTGSPGFPPDTSVARLGPLGFSHLLSLADRMPSGGVTPVPDPVGPCRSGSPLNWGAPTDPAAPCHSFFPLIAVDATLIMAGGEGQGVLVVRGDLELRGDAVFFGVVLVEGTLTLAGDSRIVGLTRAGGGAVLKDRARVDGSACVALRAFQEASSLRWGVPVPGRSWLVPLR